MTMCRTGAGAARIFAAVAALAASLALSACEMAPAQQSQPELTFAHLQPFRLDVGRVELTSAYQMPMREPHVEHVMPLSPEAAVKRWVEDRLQPHGTTGAVRVVVRDARVVEVPLPVEKGLAGLFKKQQAERYDASLEVAMHVLDERNMPQSEIIARTQRSRTAPEGMTLNDREQMWFELVEGMITELDRQLSALIPQYFGTQLLR